jgi:hypothetical protein
LERGTGKALKGRHNLIPLQAQRGFGQCPAGQRPAGVPFCKGGQGDSNTHPVSYTFTARTTDYESRFKLVFACGDGPSTSSGTFAYISNGNIIINGEGTLQVIDVMGRIVRTVGLSQSGSHTTTTGMPAGLYVLRLLDGDSVKTQKIVID